MYSYSKLCNLIEESKFNVSFSWLNLQHLRVQVVRDFVYKEKFLGVCWVHRNLNFLSLLCSNINSNYRGKWWFEIDQNNEQIGTKKLEPTQEKELVATFNRIFGSHDLMYAKLNPIIFHYFLCKTNLRLDLLFKYSLCYSYTST
jgi:hypothetical protein